MDMWDESKRISEDFQLSFQVIHHTRPGLNSPPLSSALTRSWKFFIFTVGEFNKYPKNLQNIRKNTKRLFIWHKSRQTPSDRKRNVTGKDEATDLFCPPTPLRAPELQRQIILELWVAAALRELTLLLSARCQRRHWRKPLREKCCFMLKEQWHFHCLFF